MSSFHRDLEVIDIRPAPGWRVAWLSRYDPDGEVLVDDMPGWLVMQWVIRDDEDREQVDYNGVPSRGEVEIRASLMVDVEDGFVIPLSSAASEEGVVGQTLSPSTPGLTDSDVEELRKRARQLRADEARKSEKIRARLGLS